MSNTTPSKSKIGILTFHCAHNYGAVLQAYALQEKIKELSGQAEMIDYRPDYLTHPYKLFSFQYIFSGKLPAIIKKLINSIVALPVNFKRRQNFESFINTKLVMAETENGVIPSNYDLYVVGSDQVWNHKMTQGFDQVYFGYFDIKKSAKKITYAASTGNARFEGNDLEKLKESIKNFDGISLREEETTQFIQSINNKKATTVLDPTLLVDRAVWDKLTPTQNINKKYVLIYQVQRDPQTLRIADEIASQLGAEVIELPAIVNIKNLTNKLNSASPIDYLNLIKYASCVVTTSFHGTVFSVIFNRPFYAIDPGHGVAKRSKNLLDKLELFDRLISKNDSVTFSEIDFTQANKKLEALRKDSENYLKKFL